MPPPNTPEEGVTAPASPDPSSEAARPSRGDSSLPEIDYQSIEYIEPVDETLLCPVCRTPFHSPITTPCGHTFCAGCINRALEISPTCPIDRQPINKTRDYQRVPLIVKDQLDRLKVKCPNEGCDHQCLREHLEGHYERRCEFTLVRCPDPKCTKRIARRDALPEKGCMHRTISCQYCDEAVTVAELDAHYSYDCARATARCPDCDMPVVRHRLAIHKSQHCLEGQTRCTWHTAGCKFEAKRRTVLAHESSGCVFEGVSLLMKQRAEDRRIIDDLTGRLASIETHNDRRREHERQRRERQRQRRREQGNQTTLDLLTGDMGDLSSDLEALASEDLIAFPASTSENGAWGSPEDYMLAQFERMETQMEDLRKKMMEMDAHQSLSLLQQTARVNEQLAELSSKVGVLNMHTTWLMNMQRQSHAQQRAASSTCPPGSAMAASGDTGATRGSSEDGGLRHQRSSRTNNEARGENPPRL
ncbi:hypothetical protein VTK56DRAFT_9930 [Thermocarpiscus australiensis]